MRRMSLVIALAATVATLHPSLAEVQPAPNGTLGGDENQPRAGNVLPREERAGVAAPPAQAQANGRALEDIDRSLLRSEGASTASVPSFGAGGPAQPAPR